MTGIFPVYPGSNAGNRDLFYRNLHVPIPKILKIFFRVPGFFKYRCPVVLKFRWPQTYQQMKKSGTISILKKDELLVFIVQFFS